MYLTLIFSLLLLANSDAYSNCPDVPSADNANHTELAGVWYDIAVTANDFEFGGVDALTKSTFDIEGDVITMTGQNNYKNDIDYVEGKAKRLPNGRILCTYIVGNPKVTVETLMSILALNEDFVTFYSCFADSNEVHYEVVWISSRVAKPEGAVKNRIQNYIDTFKPPASMKNVIWKTIS